MSTSKHATRHGQENNLHGHGHDHDHDAHAHGTMRGYLTGFGLSVVLTAIPFWLVMGNVLGGPVATSLAIMAFAVVQMVVHMVFFLHMHPSSEGGWSLMALFFTLILVIIAMSGSMWVMYHLNSNMMPVHDMANMDQPALRQQTQEPTAATTQENLGITPQTQQLP